MEYIVMDLEWNMPENKYGRVKRPIRLDGEIIQIGAVKLDERLEEIDEFNTKVRPVFYRKMNRKVQELTSITTADLQDGTLFEEAAASFREWCGSDSVMLTWGPSDLKMLTENLIIHEMDYDWIPETFDAQLMFDFQETMDNRNYSLDYAFYYFGLRGGKAHDALNDARDTAAVIRMLDVQEFIQEEPEYRQEQEEYAQQNDESCDA